jgi:hypothetical protein
LNLHHHRRPLDIVAFVFSAGRRQWQLHEFFWFLYQKRSKQLH